MDLSSLLPALRQSIEPQEAISSGVLPLPSSARAPVAASLISELSAPMLIVSPRFDRVLTLAQELPHWIPQSEVAIFPEPDPLFYEKLPWGVQTRLQRAEILARLASETNAESSIILASVRAIMAVTLSPEQMRASIRELQTDQMVEMQELLEFLLGIGYDPASIVTNRGQYSRRGGILDVWSNSQNTPTRIELFGDEIDSMREFDPATQRSSRKILRLQLTPAREGLPTFIASAPDQSSDLHEYYLPRVNTDFHGFLDYLPHGAVVLLDGLASVESVAHELEAQALELLESPEYDDKDAPRPYLTIEELRESLDRLAPVDLGLTTTGETPPAITVGPRFGGQIKPLMTHLLQRRIAHEVSIVVSRQANRLVDLWNEQDGAQLVMEAVPNELVPGEITFIQRCIDVKAGSLRRHRVQLVSTC